MIRGMIEGYWERCRGGVRGWGGVCLDVFVQVGIMMGR